MTKSEFIAGLADRLDISVKETSNFIDIFNEFLSEEVFEKNDKVVFPWGTLTAADVHKPARTARSPKTGETVQVAEKNYKHIPKLKVSKKYKEEHTI